MSRIIFIVLALGTLAVLLPAAQGQEAIEDWVARYNGLGNGEDGAYGLAVDDSGNVYVTGYSMGSGTDYDYATMKYNPDGNPLWEDRYNSPGNGLDAAYALAMDDSGNVYVTGGSLYDYATIKYNPNGDTAWVARYNGPGNAGDEARALAVDASGNVYVTGYSWGIGTLSDYATIKYDADGNQLWVAYYNGPDNEADDASALALDDSGNVYVTGRSVGIGTNADYATVKYDTAGNEVWATRYNGPGNGYDDAQALALDASGNVYVTGMSGGSGTGYDYATIKHAPNGDTLWVARYNGPGNDYDYATALALDASGNVYVTGPSTGIGSAYDYATIKYDPDGNELWAARYNGPGNGLDWAHALALDDSGNVFVTGRSQGVGIGEDYATIKYIANGSEIWVARYNGPGNGDDRADAITLDASGNIYVTGRSAGLLWGPDYATIRYIDLSPDLELSTSVLDFGTVTVGEQADLPITISNAGIDTLQLYYIYCGTTFFTTDWNPANQLILPDSSLEIAVTFAPEDTVAYVDVLYIESSGGDWTVDLSGQGIAPTGIKENPPAIPNEFALRGPYPNPFNPVTTFKIELPVASWVTLEIYDITGRTQGSPLQGWRNAGYHEVTFDASGLASGVYVYRLEAGDFNASGKMMLMK